MFSIFTHVMKPVRDTNSEPGLPVLGPAFRHVYRLDESKILKSS